MTQTFREKRWNATDTQHGKFVHLRDFPKGHRVKLFRLELSTERTEYVATNDLTQSEAQTAQEACGWAILVWIRLKQVAYETAQTIYQVKQSLLSDYMRQQLRSRL